MGKIIWIWNHYATEMAFNKGGRHYWFAKNLLKRGYKPVIFTASTFHNNPDENIETNSDRYSVKEVDGICFIFVRARPASGNGVNRILNMLSFFFNLFKVSRKIADTKGRPDLILGSSVHPLTLVAGIKVAIKLGIPCICEVRDLWPEAIFEYTRLKKNSVIGRILQKGEYWIYQKADAVIFTMEGYKDYLTEQGWDVDSGGKLDLNKTFYINNGLDLEDFNKALSVEYSDEDLLSGKFNVVYAGSIRPANNVGSILNTAKLLKGVRDLQFLIYGDGNEREHLERRIIEEKIENVKVKGRVDKKYIPVILSHSSVNLLNYASEGVWKRGSSNNKLFEYMASGKPIISNIKIGYSLVNKYNCGIELDENNAECLAGTILKIKDLDEKDYEQLCNNAKAAADDFDFDIHTDNLERIIKSLT